MNIKTDDAVLVEKFLKGDESAFNLIVIKYRQRIYWHARRMTGNHFDADEVLQEVLIVLYEKLSNFRSKSSLYTWIYKITSTRAINLLRRNKVRSFFSIDDDDRPDIPGEDDILGNLENKEKLSLLDSVLQKLPEKQREVFILRHFDELSYEEIAEITGKSVGGLKANYFHAARRVAELMEEYNEK